MKPVFEIIPQAIFFQQTTLICEISLDGFSYVFENDIDKKFHGLSVFYFDTDKEVSKQLNEIFNEQPLLQKEYKKVCISYSGQEFTLLPEEMYKPGENELLLNTLFGDLHDGSIATDLIADKKIYNVYRIPSETRKAITDRFPLASFNHHYSLLAKQNISGDLLKVIFYKTGFVAVLIKDGELQFVQMYPYHSGTDVIYRLLNICQQFKMDNVPLCLGGMIDIDSDLHKEVYYYFSNLSFDELPEEYEFANNLRQLPPHYFSHLFSLALCV